ncbi:MAG: hypothetical protein LBP35_01915 [Candidatus Ancillula trichonymphae]|nr:hypothetical protein [Candidatus Ancillula trichonymphae]
MFDQEALNCKYSVDFIRLADLHAGPPNYIGDGLSVLTHVQTTPKEFNESRAKISELQKEADSGELWKVSTAIYNELKQELLKYYTVPDACYDHGSSGFQPHQPYQDSDFPGAPFLATSAVVCYMAAKIDMAHPSCAVFMDRQNLRSILAKLNSLYSAFY